MTFFISKRVRFPKNPKKILQYRIYFAKRLIGRRTEMCKEMVSVDIWEMSVNLINC